jgi:hypothetical protein
LVKYAPKLICKLLASRLQNVILEMSMRINMDS